MTPGRRPDPEPYELDNSRVVAVLTLGWVVALLVLAVAGLLGYSMHPWWLAMCGYGTLLGLAGLRLLARRKAALRASARRRP